ncbi:hypothetical protein ACEN2J_14490 [Pseudorhodobacter sp. W20_MBD10_FR17]|uniref:hypothetical protein n=1 Tax=Pseudorhodobacter sp. W20_MBD10_FR17 TaxID=3240266 RepID=UPI003F9B2F05
MTAAPSDPIISKADICAELGISPGDWQKWRKAGYLPPASGRGNSTLLAAMRGIIAAVRAEAEAVTPYAAAPVGVPPGAVLIADAEGMVAEVVAAYDRALAEALTAIEVEISALHRPPVAPEKAKRCRAAEGARTELYAVRRRAAGFGRNAVALAARWAEQ